jgi:hypothetical protein
VDRALQDQSPAAGDRPGVLGPDHPVQTLTRVVVTNHQDSGPIFDALSGGCGGHCPCRLAPFSGQSSTQCRELGGDGRDAHRLGVFCQARDVWPRPFCSSAQNNQDRGPISRSLLRLHAAPPCPLPHATDLGRGAETCHSAAHGPFGGPCIPQNRHLGMAVAHPGEPTASAGMRRQRQRWSRARLQDSAS